MKRFVFSGLEAPPGSAAGFVRSGLHWVGNPPAGAAVSHRSRLAPTGVAPPPSGQTHQRRREAPPGNIAPGVSQTCTLPTRNSAHYGAPTMQAAKKPTRLKSAGGQGQELLFVLCGY